MKSSRFISDGNTFELLDEPKEDVKNDWTEVERAPAGTSEGGQWTSGSSHKQIAQNLLNATIPDDYTGETSLETEGGITTIGCLGDGLQWGLVYEHGAKQVEFTVMVASGKYKGKGVDIFNNMVNALSSAGFENINVDAVGEGGKNNGENGYYTWLRLGFIPNEGEATKLVSKFNAEHNADAKNLQELIGIKSGQEWWKKNGKSFYGDFDLTDNSYSMKTLKNYMDARKRNK